MLSFLQVRNQYQIIYKVDSNKFTDIFIARCIPTNNVVTIKIHNLDDQIFNGFKCNFRALSSDVSFWFNEQHQNLIHYYGSFLYKYQLWSISEFMDCGSCTDALRQLYPNGIDNEIVISTIMKSVLSFISFLHKDNKTYQRISPNNILLSANGNVKMDLIYTLGKEFSDSQYIPPESKVSSPQKPPPKVSPKNKKSDDAVTPLWAQKLNEHKEFERQEPVSEKCSEKIDIWDIGITCIELAIGKSPDKDVIELIRSKSTLPNRNNFSSSFFDFINSCIKVNPAKRPSAEQLLQHKFIKSAQDPNYLKIMITSLLLPLNQQYERLNSNENNLEKYVHQPTKPIDCAFDLPIKSKNAEKLPQKDGDNDNFDTRIKYPTKKIGRVTLAGPENSLKQYL